MLLPNYTADRLHLGSGLEAPRDWLNVDGSLQASFARRTWLKQSLVALRVYPHSQASIPWPTNVQRLNLNKPLPFPSNRFEALYSSHTFEHLYREGAVRLARECYRVLRPGGICRIVVPDLEAAVERYRERRAEGDTSASAADQLLDELMLQPREPARGKLGWYHSLMNVHQHKWMYDAESLSALLRGAGFESLSVFRSRQGELPGLEEIEKPSRIENGAGVAVEGRK